MKDLHTHILPGMDDGAKTVEDALAMLQEQVKQGVDAVALTPHYYRNDESIERFLGRRKDAWEKLCEHTQGQAYPEMILGAEVAWSPGMSEWDRLDELCYHGTKVILVELPMFIWGRDVFYQLHNLENRCGIMPIIAHVERYIIKQGRRNMDQLFEMGYPVQITAELLLHKPSRKGAIELLGDYDALIASDCHNLEIRRPNLGEAMQVLEKKCGKKITSDAIFLTDEILED